MKLRKILSASYLAAALALPIGDNCEIQDVNVNFSYNTTTRSMRFNNISIDEDRRPDLVAVYQICNGQVNSQPFAVFNLKRGKYCIKSKHNEKYESKQGSDPRRLSPEEIPKCL